ncbi:MAG: ferritin-like domain-containing protein, partial [Acidimicrobiales bacterium]
MSTTDDTIARSDPNDVDAILAVDFDDRGEAIHIVESNGDAIYTWSYDKGERAQLDKLYEKAKHGQWNAQ